MKEENKKLARTQIQRIVSGIAERLMKNESKLEAAIFGCALLFAVVSCVLNIITGIAAGGVWDILRPLTVGLVLLFLTLLLPASDEFFVVRGKSLVLIAYSALSLVLSGVALAGADGVLNTILAVLGLLAALALYGTLMLDQFVVNDKPVKYWLVYSGALYFIFYSLVMLILDGVRATGVLGALAAVFGGLASIFVILMLLCLFDGLSFAEYMFYEIVDADDNADDGGVDDPGAENVTDNLALAEEEPEAEDTGGAEMYVPYEEEQPSEAAPEPQERGDTPAGADEGEELPEEEVYRPFDDIVYDYEPSCVALPDEAAEAEPGKCDEPAGDTEGEGSEESSRLAASAGISPVELKYAKFAAAHHKPDSTLQVTGMSGDLFDVWVDGDRICFLNDLGQAMEGRGVRSAVIPFGEVTGLGLDKLEEGAECVVLTYEKDGEVCEIRFAKESFGNFRQVLEQAAGEQDQAQ
ncbi:MAG TPA: hypothetical protein GX011_00880 [Clostridiales bacterium]|jgi:hypothetical protein|nr:hypothetical protein [Clostridiales bacterium]